MKTKLKMLSMSLALAFAAGAGRAELVATVGGEKIDDVEFKAKASAEERNLNRALSPEEKQAILQALVNQRLLVAEARSEGPYGRYPTGPLSREDTAGPSYRMGAATRRALGPRLAAAFEHVHMLVFHPRDAEPAALQALLDAGWSTTDIVTLSQIVAFLSFQIRVVIGLRTLAGRP